MSKIDSWFEKYYFSQPGYLSGTTEFHMLAKQALGGTNRILEIGAGPGNQTSAFLSGIGDLQGVDVSEEIHTNRYLRAAEVYDGKELPYASEQFDLCVSDYVLEHVEDPGKHFQEVARV